MRVLVTANDAFGHVLPLVPLTQALAARGHEVLFASPGPTAEVAAQHGVAVRAFVPRPVPPGPPPPPRTEREARLVWAVTSEWPNEARAWAGDLVDAAREWRPDLVVCEPVEHAGRVAAAALGVPWVEHGWGFSLPAGLDAVGLEDLYARFGTAPVAPGLRVDLGPAGVQASDIAVVERFRYAGWAPSAPPLPAPTARRVLVTLGTFAHPDAAERIRVATEAVAELDVEVVVAVGNSDRDVGRSWPPGVVVSHWLDLVSEIPVCALVVHHGGAGTSWGTLSAGVPAVCLPQAGDQFRNGALIADAGAGLVVQPEDVDLDTVGAAVESALGDREMSLAAREVAADNALLPGAQAMVDCLEGLLR